MSPRADSGRRPPVVIKIGGSVLTGPRAYARAARWLIETRASPAGFSAPLLVVVSAERGTTDRLQAEAEAIAASPDPRARDLLWATGELRSAALLALHLQARGVATRALSVHEAGVRAAAGALRVRPRWVARALQAHAVVIVPGFLAANEAGEIVSLGRGGSDLSAVMLAAALGAPACELVKDVAGYFTADPASDAGARHVPRIDVESALVLARAGCPLVQPAALEAARDRGVPLIIRAASADARRTIVFTKGADINAIRHEDHSRRAAVRT